MKQKDDVKLSGYDVKDPAFPMYARDFLVGVSDMSLDECGAYVKLLCYQWIRGGIPKQRLGFILGYGWEDTWDIVGPKFTEADDGLLYNDRLESERTKRRLFREKQAINGRKGGRPSKKALEDKPKQKPNDTQIQTQKNPLEKEKANEEVNEKVNELPDKIGWKNLQNLEELSQSLADPKIKALTPWFEFHHDLPIMTIKALIMDAQEKTLDEIRKAVQESIKNNYKGLIYKSQINATNGPQKTRSSQIIDTSRGAGKL